MMESERRRRGEKPKRNAGELAIADFLSSEDGLKRNIREGDPVLLLYEDRDVRVINKPPSMHLLSTVGLVKGLERLKLIPSANDAIRRMMRSVRDPGELSFSAAQGAGQAQDAVLRALRAQVS